MIDTYIRSCSHILSYLIEVAASLENGNLWWISVFIYFWTIFTFPIDAWCIVHRHEPLKCFCFQGMLPQRFTKICDTYFHLFVPGLTNIFFTYACLYTRFSPQNDHNTFHLLVMCHFILINFVTPSVFPKDWPMCLAPFFTYVSWTVCFATNSIPNKTD